MEEEEPCGRQFLMMSDIVHDYTSVVTGDHTAFRTVECGRKEAYGCGETGDRVVKGLTLFARAGHGEIGSLCIRATADVLSCVGSEVDDEAAEIYGRQIRLSARIHTVAGNVMVLRVSFLAKHCYGDFRSYYLIYDSADASLSLLPLRPPHCRPVCTECPLVIKIKVGEGKKYSLVLMAQRSSGSAEQTHPVMCLWSPPPSTANSNPDINKCPWELKARGPEDGADRFNASVSFSCKGNAVWGDLRQGILYCDCSQLTDAGSTDPIDLKLVPLPSQFRTPYFPYSLERDIMPVDRNMARVGDLVWFVVVIEPSYRCPDDTLVKVWTLDLQSPEEGWSLHKEFDMQGVWWSMAYGWPRTVPPVTVPEFPFFRKLKDDVCALYLMLPAHQGGGDHGDALLCFDLTSSCDGVIVVWTGRLARPRLMDRPIVLD